MPKRRFLKELSAWRRSLHEFQEWLGNERRRNPQARTSYPQPQGNHLSKITCPVHLLRVFPLSSINSSSIFIIHLL